MNRDPILSMSLRDFFAAHALQGMLASEVNGEETKAEDLASSAYHIASRMLDERQHVIEEDENGD